MTRLVTLRSSVLFFFNDTATTEIYTLSLHDALPIFGFLAWELRENWRLYAANRPRALRPAIARSEEHTSELQSHLNIVCRLLLDKTNARSSITRAPVAWSVAMIMRNTGISQ